MEDLTNVLLREQREDILPNSLVRILVTILMGLLSVVGMNYEINWLIYKLSLIGFILWGIIIFLEIIKSSRRLKESIRRIKELRKEIGMEKTK